MDKKELAVNKYKSGYNCAQAVACAYPVIKPMIEAFKEENGYIDCFDILKHGEPGTEDGKRLCCIHCVEHAVDNIESLRMKGK